MFKRILVPLDGSELAEAVLPQVEDLARCHGSEILLLRIVSEPVLDYAHTVPMFDSGWREDMEAEATAYLKGIQERLSEAGFKVQAKVESGPVSKGIIDCSAKDGADLIAMSTHGRGGLERLLLGSVAEQVVQRALVPVLLFRPR